MAEKAITQGKGELGEDRDGYLSPGHNSILHDEDSGKYFIIYHTRFEGHDEEHQVRVHQLFFNADGWPVIAPYRYVGETAGAVSADDIAGSYKLINHGREISAEMHESVSVKLSKDGKVSGDVSGSWTLTGDNQTELVLDGQTYKGLFLVQWDEDGQKDVMTFTALDAEAGISVWGSGLSALED